MVRTLPLVYGADTYMHSGYSSELLDGEATPSAAITGQIPNAYPWLFHGAEALTARLTPGGRTVDALAPLQVALVAGTILGLFALGRAITRRTAGGVATALLAGMTGGFGYFLARGPAVVYAPRGHTTALWGDSLFVRSYNPSFYNMTPPFPRDLAFGLAVCALALALCGLRTKSTGLLVLAGVVLGLTGLADAESFFLGAAVFALFVLAPVRISRERALLTLLVPALAPYAFWLIPQAISYAQLGGYVNLTAVGPVSLPAWAIVFSWGIMLPLALVGTGVWLRGPLRDPGRRLVTYVLVSAGFVTLLSTLVPRLLGEAFMTLGRSHRYWPLLGFALALIAAPGLCRLTDRASSMVPRVAVWAAAVVLAVPSPALAGVALPGIFEPPSLQAAARGDADALLNLIAPRPGGRCVAAVPRDIGPLVWSYTGYRLVMFWTSEPHPGNKPRIRWADIYQRIVPQRRRQHDNIALVTGEVSRRRWKRIAARYGVDVVVARDDAVVRGRGFPVVGARADDLPYTVFRLTGCGR
jgi:hypothetical protein